MNNERKIKGEGLNLNVKITTGQMRIFELTTEPSNFIFVSYKIGQSPKRKKTKKLNG